MLGMHRATHNSPGRRLAKAFIGLRSRRVNTLSNTFEFATYSKFLPSSFFLRLLGGFPREYVCPSHPIVPALGTSRIICVSSITTPGPFIISPTKRSDKYTSRCRRSTRCIASRLCRPQRVVPPRFSARRTRMGRGCRTVFQCHGPEKKNRTC